MPVPAPYVFGRSTTGPSARSAGHDVVADAADDLARGRARREEAVERVEDGGARAAQERQPVDEQRRGARRGPRRWPPSSRPSPAPTTQTSTSARTGMSGARSRITAGAPRSSTRATSRRRRRGSGRSRRGTRRTGRRGRRWRPRRGSSISPASGCLRDAYSRMCSSLGGPRRHRRAGQRRRDEVDPDPVADVGRGHRPSSGRSGRPWPPRRRASRTAPGRAPRVVTLPRMSSEPREPASLRRLLAHRPDDPGAGQDLRPQVEPLGRLPGRGVDACGSARRRTAGRCRRRR